MNRNDVFISYRRSNKAFTRRLVEKLKSENLNVWIDWEDIPPGSDDFTQDIHEGIAGADVVIPVLSPVYLDSEYCMGELQLAIDEGKRILPIIYETVNADRVPKAISHVNWIYFTPHVGEQNDFDTAFPRLMRAINTDRDHVSMHTRVYLRAQEWDQNNRDHSFLLSGTELRDAERWLATSQNKEPQPTTLHNTYINASLEAERNRFRQLLSGVSVALVVSLILAAVAFFQFLNSEALNRQVRSLLWSNNANQAITEGDNLLAIQLAREATRIQNPPVISQRILASAGYMPGIVRQMNGDGSIWSLDTAIIDDRWQGISGDQNGNVILWNLMQETGTPAVIGTHEGSIWSAAMTTDGTRAITGGADSMIKFWDAATGTLLAEYTEPAPVWSADFSDDGQYAVIGNLAGELVLFAVEDNTLRELDRDKIHNDAVWSVDFSPAGASARIVSGGADDSISITEYSSSGLGISRSRQYTADVWSVAFSPDGKRFVSGTADNTITIWNLDTLSSESTLEGHRDRILALDFSSDGQTLASVDAFGDLMLWNLATNLQERRLRGHDGSIWAVHIHPDNNMIVTAGADSALSIWNRSSAARLNTLTGHTDWVTGLATHADSDGAIIGTSSRAGDILIHDVTTGQIIAESRIVAESVNGLAFHPTQPYLLSISADALVRVWRWQRGQALRQPLEIAGHGGIVNSVQFSDDGNYFVTTGSDSRVIVWEWDSTAIEQAFNRNIDWTPTTYELVNNDTIDNAHEGAVNTAAFVPNRRLLTVISGGADNRVLQWEIDTETGSLTAEERYEHNDDVTTLAISSDGRHLVSGSADNQLSWQDLTTGTLTSLRDEHTDTINAITFIPDQPIVITTGADSLILSWNLANRDELVPERIYTDTAESTLTLGYVDSRIITGNTSNEIVIWQYHTLDELREWIAANREIVPLSLQECRRYNPNPSECEIEETP